MITVSQSISPQRIASLLVGAFEGGSNYWLGEVTASLPPLSARMRHLDGSDEGGRFWKLYDSPLCEGGSVAIETNEGDGKNYTLDLASIAKGLQIMASKVPEHFADFMNENDDATTSDVFLQLCLFGEVVYG